MSKYNHHFNTQNMPKRVEPVRSSYYIAGVGILPLSVAEYVCVRLTGMMPPPQHVPSYPHAMAGTWKQVEFTVWTKAQEAAQTVPKPPPAPKPMPHQQSTLRGHRGPTHATFGPFFSTPFDPTQEDV